MKPLFFFGLMALAAAGDACAQSVPGSFAARAPGLWLNGNPADFKPMQMKAAGVEVKVRGHLATTTVEMTFHNPNGRVMEGEFVFPLGEGQTVSGYALDIEGKMRQAVVVEKQQGRQIFEEIVRRGIDPGLAEVLRGNVFRTRIYPIMANGVRRVAVTFEQELYDEGDRFGYALPLTLPSGLEQYRVRVEVVKAQEAPEGKGEGAGTLAFQRQRDSHVAEYSTKDAKSTQPVAFSVKKRSDRTGIFLAREGDHPSRLCFHARVEPEIPEAPSLPAPGHIALYYDASGSAGQRDRAHELAFLETWLKKLGQVKVDLVVVRDVAAKPVTFDIKNGDAAQLRKAIEATSPDGGTSLGSVDVSLIPEADSVVLISDGFSTFGKSEPTLRRRDGTAPPFLAVHAAGMADSANLERLARSVKGRVLNLLKWSTEDAVAAVGKMPFQFLQARVISGKVDEMSPAQPSVVTKDFVIAGRAGGRAELELDFGYEGKVAFTQRIVLDPKDALASDRGAFIRRAWAQCRLAELALDAESHQAEMVALGKEHGIVTAGTSLMVLERIDDYVRNRLEPKEAELRAKYFAALKKNPGWPPAPPSEALVLGRVEKLWADFKSWHGKSHAWLETVLPQAAQREASMYWALAVREGGGPPGAFLRREDAAAAQALMMRSNDLVARWPGMKPQEADYKAWVNEAMIVLRAVTALREQRYQQSPDSDPDGRFRGATLNLSTGGGFGMGGAGGGFGRGTGTGFSDTGDAFIASGSMRLGASLVGGSLPQNAPSSSASTPPSSVVAASAPSPAKAPSTQDKTLRTQEAKAAGGEVTAPYLDTLRAAQDPVAVYTNLREWHATSSAFFADSAEFFRKVKKDDAMALRILSNLAEIELESPTVLRLLAFRLREMGRHDLAAVALEEVLKMRGEEPQSHRDLALCLLATPSPDYARATALLWEVVKRPWDFRFPGIQVTALHELNDLLQHIPEDCPKDRRPDLARLGIEPRFLANIPVALRAVVTWDTDNTDIDVWVTDPVGDVCTSNRNRTQTGGFISPNFARGYGPEVFTIRRPLPGTYTMMVRLLHDSSQKRSSPPTVRVEMQSGFNNPGITSTKTMTSRLEEPFVAVEVGTFVVKPEDIPAPAP